MIFSNTADLVVRILRSYIKNEKLNIDLNEEQIKDLFLVMKAHDLTHIPGLVLKGANTEPKYEMFRRAQFFTAIRFEEQEYQRNKITELFEENKIRHIHLKGSVIAKVYREPWHRPSRDIDILLPDKDIERAVSVLSDKLGYTLQESMTNHDVSLFLNDAFHVELHYDLRKDGIDLNDAVDSMTPVNGKNYEYIISPEIIMLYHYAHMAAHFRNGGIGLKSMLDLYLLEQNLKYDKDILNELLIKGNLKKFSESTLHLAKVWFDDEESDEITEYLGKYIIDSSAYGSMKHVVSVRMNDTNKLRYALKRIFLPYENLKYVYPILQKHKFLIPVYQVKRWFTLITPKRIGKVKNEVKTFLEMEKDTPNEVLDMLKELELLDTD